MREVIGKAKLNNEKLPRRLTVEGKNIYDKDLIANNFNTFFVNIGPQLASNIRKSTKSFKSYLKETLSAVYIV